MARTKKSRKPGGAPTAKPKLSKVELANVEKRLRKKNGNKPGNRQQEAKLIKNPDQQSDKNKDPRIGSKTPIDLGRTVAPTKKKAVKITKAKQDPIAAIRVVNAEEEQSAAQEMVSFAQELDNIEADERLQAILAKQEEALALSEQEVDYFNEMMERHQQLTEKLAENEEPKDESTNVDANSEEDLWDKLDNSSLPSDVDKFE
ncbi:Der GTPase-activating protein YihI [Candidatus Colwellia aromaticivorans]|uniref:Der GTPase-activating protein YihI n=1 Tax=Candidatus Colwellia aromaticivorans TaxID=2267621 RepID=UPI000DF1C7F8|nr:Der GTPase-activating protein YihI [Candidatus Colwellia aromaticivorans]